MQRVLEMMLDALLETWRAAAPWLSDAVAAVPTWAWASIGTLVLVGVAVRMVRPTRVDAGAVPDLLFTRVELVADRPGSDRYAVDVGFSNLHHEPVQLLRIAVDGRTGRSVVRDVPSIVPARRAVDLESAVTLTPGGRGRLDLYAVVPSSPAKAWRIRVPLEWEPFLQRYSAVLLDQTVRAVRRLPRTSEVEARPRVDPRATDARPSSGRRSIGDTRTADGVGSGVFVDVAAVDGAGRGGTPGRNEGSVGTAVGSNGAPPRTAIREATGAERRGASAGLGGPVAPVEQPPIAGLGAPRSSSAWPAVDATFDSAPATPSETAPSDSAPADSPRSGSAPAATAESTPAVPSDETHDTAPRVAEEAPNRRASDAPEPRSDADGTVASQPPKTPRLRFPDRF